MEEQGIVGPADGSRPREVLVSSFDDVFGAPAAPENSANDTPPEAPSPREKFLVQ
jgi:hypothetical protein